MLKENSDTYVVRYIFQYDIMEILRNLEFMASSTLNGMETSIEDGRSINICSYCLEV